MPMTVEEVVHLGAFQTAKIRTGIETLSQRRVEWMSAIEGPVEHFVRKKEFILTSGMGFENDEAQLLTFVKDVFRAGASALAIATGRYIFHIPQKVIDYCRQNEYILIELPWEVRFADVQRETMEEMNRRQAVFSETARHMQQTLIHYVIQDLDLSEIIQFVERELNCMIVFSDNKGRKKSTVDNPDKWIDLWFSLDTLEDQEVDETSFLQAHVLADDEGYLLKKDLTSGTKNLTQGYFIILFETKELMTDYAKQVLESLAAATALWISREDAIVKTEIRLRNEFIWALAKSAETNYDENLLSRAKLFGYQLTVPYIAVVGYSENFDSFADEKYGKEASGFKNIIYYIEEEVRYAASLMDKHVAFTFDGKRLIIFLELATEDLHSVHHFLDLIDKRLHALVPGVTFSWGIGKSGDGMMKFHESYQKANAALEMGIEKQSVGFRHHFSDTKLKRLLLQVAKDPEVKHITLRTIKPLIDYEKDRDIDLIETFIAYDNHHGNVSQAARTLNLHRQSLLYRLRKIEDLTSLSLDQPDDVFLLNLSIKVWLSGAIKT